MNTLKNSMDEIKELKERIQFLEEKYNDLVNRITESTCQCKKPMWMHFQKPEKEFKEELLNKIK
jgi:hypothetical protein